jgi:hypothetical protein
MSVYFAVVHCSLNFTCDFAAIFHLSQHCYLLTWTSTASFILFCNYLDQHGLPRQLHNFTAQTTRSVSHDTMLYLQWQFRISNPRLIADIFCRKVKSEPARVEPLKVDRWRIPKNGGPCHVRSRRKRWRRCGHRSSGRSSLISDHQNCRTTVMCT